MSSRNRGDKRKKNYVIGFGIIVMIILGYYFIFSDSNSSFSPEELNSILQNKHQAIVSINKHELKSQALQQPYLNPGNLRMNDWDTKGNTLIKNKEYIRLTYDAQHQVGSIFNKHPLTAESFEMELTFHISSKSTNGLIGDGLAIWLLDSPSEIGDVFGGQNQFNGLGIFIDTYKNGKRGNFPYVNLMLGDGTKFYNKDLDGYDTRLAGCSAKDLLNSKNGQTKMRLVYIKNGYLSIDFNWKGDHEDWKNCVSLTDIKLPKSLYLGFSAETGDLSHNVDIIENKIYGLFKYDETYVESLYELQVLIEDEKENQNESNKKSKKTNRRKSAARLRNAERRIKQREREYRLEKYGDPDARLVKRIKQKVITLIRYTMYILGFVLLIWFSWIIYRIQKQKRKQKVVGLLD